MDATDHPTAPIPGTARSVRRLDAQESAFSGDLVADGDVLRVRVDIDAVPDALWHFSDAEHVAGVLDVARRADGQDALLPWCSESVDGFLARRAAAEQPLVAGEIVTLVGSLLRGIVETSTADADVRGRWWLTADGRPLFVPGEGVQCGSASVEIMARVRQDCTDRAMERTLTEISSGVQDPREVVRSIERWEQELTELAAPRPLHREVHPPERVSAIPLHQALLPQEARRVSAQRSVVMTVRARWDALAEWVREHRPQRPAKGAPRARSSVVARAQERASSGGRGRMLIVGAVVAGAVLVGGLLWPTGDDSAATAGAGEGTEHSTAEQSTAETAAGEQPDTNEGSPSTPPAEQPVASPEPSPSADGGDVAQAGDGAQGDVARAAARLLDEIVACAQAGETHCEEAVVAGAGELVLQRLAGASADRGVSPIEDYGDIAVLRLTAVEGVPEQMLVIVREKDRWLVRDVYDVADQPSGAG